MEQRCPVDVNTVPGVVKVGCQGRAGSAIAHVGARGFQNRNACEETRDGSDSCQSAQSSRVSVA